MIEDRIGELRLRVRTDATDADALRPDLERVVRTALERCATLLEQRAPGRIVLVRHLPLRWSADRLALADEDAIESLARTAVDLIEHLATAARPAGANSGGAGTGPGRDAETEDEVAVFEDEADYRAAHLLAAARGRLAWFHAPLERENGDPVVHLASRDRVELARATLLRLARIDALAEVLATRPSASLAALAEVLRDPTPPFTTGAGDEPARPGPVDSEPLDQLRTACERWPVLSPPARQLALRAHAAALLNAAWDAPETLRLQAAVEALAPSPAPRPGSEVPNPPAGDGSSRGMTSAGVSEHPPEAPPPGHPDSGALAAEIPTECAGLFYLLDRLQELDLPEALWKACLPEGVILAAAVRALLGVEFESDAVLPFLAGGSENPGFPEITAEQLEEVVATTTAELAAALPRRGLAEIPPVTVSLEAVANARLLVAAAEGSPFAFFAWPASTPALIESGLRVLLDRWPPRARLSASPALVALDVTGRLQPLGRGAERKLHLPAGPTAAACALLAVVLGAPGQLLLSRAGVPIPADASGFVRRFLRRPGGLRLGPESLDVILAASDLDLELRRAGLDRDPGWVPWLGRTVRLVFRSDAPPADEIRP